jgi:hypothetical protein
LPGLGPGRQAARSRIPVKVKIVPQDPRLPPFWGTTEDLSSRGVFVRSLQRLPLEARVTLELYPSQGQQRIKVEAEVVHRIPGFGFGCAFVGLSKVEQVRISWWIASACRKARLAAS